MIESFLFRVQPFDPMTLGPVAAPSSGWRCSSAFARRCRAARVDLGAVLKEE
jgi:hypothetical protein